MSSNQNGNEKGNENGNEKENEEENQNENDKTLIIKQLNDSLDEIIDKSKSFEEQIKSIKKNRKPRWDYYISDYGNKEFEFKIFKLKLAHLSNIIHKKLFEQIFGHTFETLPNKLINTTKKMRKFNCQQY